MEAAQKILQSQQNTIHILSQLLGKTGKTINQSATSMGNTWGQMQQFKNQAQASPSVIDIELDMEDVTNSINDQKQKSQLGLNSEVVQNDSAFNSALFSAFEK